MSASRAFQRGLLSALSIGGGTILILSGWLLWPVWGEYQAELSLLHAVKARDMPEIDRTIEEVKKSGGGRSVVPGLLQMLDDKDYDLQRAAFHALFSLDPQAAARAPVEVTTNPGAIASRGSPANESTRLLPGDFVEIDWGGQWWAGKVVALEPAGIVRVHYVGWDSAHDEAVERERLRVRGR